MRVFRPLAVLVLAAVLASAAQAAVPPLLNYQGRLNDGDGEPVTGSRTITFELFNVSAGGAAIYSETQS